MSKHELVIRNGTVVDGSGEAPFTADLAIDGDRIVAIGSDVGDGDREIDAKGLLVTPGWVDIHAHYDAQATWDPMLSPSSEHGVTTVVLGNCGVGFAPVRESLRDELIDLMEAVEDIPGAAMHEGIKWEWETFPEFMNALERRDHAIDYGLQVPHCALRSYVMGQRGIDNETATKGDIQEMKQIVQEALRAGALGFSTSRTEMHNTLKGDPVPGTFADHDELFGIGEALAEEKAGVFQMSLTHREVPGEMGWMKELAKKTGRIVTFNLQQIDEAPDLYKEALRGLDEAREEGITNLRGQFSGRPVGVMMGWETSIHPFLGHPEYVKLMKLPIADRLDVLRQPETKARLIEGGELRTDALPKNAPIPAVFLQFLAAATKKMYPMGGGHDYEPDPSDSVAGRAKSSGRAPAEIVYDALMDQGGKGLLYFPLFGYATSRFDAIEETMLHPQTGLSLADGGAHCGAICDAGTPTFMLMHWARDRKRGEQLPLEFIVKRQTRDTAHQYGLFDRGELRVGLKADVNVIDFENLGLESPHMRHDFPAGGRRLYQGATGYRATIASGKIIFENGEATGALPGKLIRGSQPGVEA
ncbi:MAG: amidohydrolase family protein [Myxococcales bacterium]|nr:D-aminoacylase [Myxococcales bacterium]HIK84178.1 D-aminoacylase [Myxococcales bacterium]